MDGLPKADIRQGRDLELEAQLIAEAQAEADAGLLIPAEQVKAWIESLDSASPLPLPQSPDRCS